VVEKSKSSKKKKKKKIVGVVGSGKNYIEVILNGELRGGE
jgi:hypothetical protein